MVCWIYWPGVIFYATRNTSIYQRYDNATTCRIQNILSTIFHTQKPTLTDNTSALRINNVIYASRTFQHFTLRWNCIRCHGVICFYNSNYILRLHLNVFGTKLHIYATDQRADSIIMHIPSVLSVLQNYFLWKIIAFIYCSEIVLTTIKIRNFAVVTKILLNNIYCKETIYISCIATESLSQ